MRMFKDPFKIVVIIIFGVMSYIISGKVLDIIPFSFSTFQFPSFQFSMFQIPEWFGYYVIFTILLTVAALYWDRHYSRFTSATSDLVDMSVDVPPKTPNHCVAHLITKDNKIHKYFAISSVFKDQKKADEISAKYDVVCCQEIEVLNRDGSPILPIKRLYPELEWGEFVSKEDEQSFAYSRNHCTERKILRYILREYEDRMDELKESVLVLSTKLDPCLYCYQILNEVKENKIFKEIFVYYPEMVYEIDANLAIEGVELIEDDFKKIMESEERKLNEKKLKLKNK